MSEASKIINKEQCPECAAMGRDTMQDNLCTYEDGGKFCHACSYTEGNKEKNSIFIEGTVQALTKRNISAETCQLYGYKVGTNKYGQAVHIANYYKEDGKTLLAQKLRTKDKKFPILGKSQNLPLYGQWLFNATDKISIIVTEGEIDAMSIYQAAKGQFPVVSIPYGANPKTAEQLKPHLNWLMKFKSVIFAFDNDDAGQDAAQSCLNLFEPGAAKNIIWNNAKDANELLQDHKESDIIRAIVTAKTLAPSNIVTTGDLITEILTPTTAGLPYPYPSLTNITYGFRAGEIITLVAPTGIGKTEFANKILKHFYDQGIAVGICSFEQTPANTFRRIIGTALNKKLHLPGTEFDVSKVEAEALKLNDKVFCMDCPGKASLDEIFIFIKYLNISKGCKLFLIDNLKGLRLGSDRDKAEYFMTTLQHTCNKYGVTVILLSHVTKDTIAKQAYVSTSPKRKEDSEAMTKEDMDKIVNKDGMTWQTGRRPTIEHIEGSNIVSALSDLVIGLSRHTTSEDITEKNTLVCEVLKCRIDSGNTGKIFNLFYTSNGDYVELGAPISTLPPSTDEAF